MHCPMSHRNVTFHTLPVTRSPDSPKVILQQGRLDDRFRPLSTTVLLFHLSYLGHLYVSEQYPATVDLVTGGGHRYWLIVAMPMHLQVHESVLSRYFSIDPWRMLTSLSATIQGLNTYWTFFRGGATPANSL